MADIKAYLAAKYMSGPKADAILARTEHTHKKKKRKLETNAAAGGVAVVDEDEFGGSYAGEEEVDAPVVAEGPKSFRATKAGWKTAAPSTDAATPSEASPAPEPIKKKRGGLLTAAELREESAALEVRRRAEEAARAAADPAEGPAVDPRKTVYRDKTGAIIDVAAAEAAERLARAEEVRKEREKKEWGKGLVQRSAREERTRTEHAMGKKDVARYANDKDMNEELRAVERADDPAAAFLTKRKAKGPQRPKYTGPPPPPNRFNIPPGYRWDGVDRSTGFEAKLFQTINSRSRRQVEANAWSMEDM